MEVFLNEQSLRGQYAGMEAFTSAVTTVNGVLARVSELPVEKAVYCHVRVYYKTAVAPDLFSVSLAHMREKSVRLQFKLLLERLGAADWLGERLHEDCAYIWSGQDVRDTTLAEHAERRFQERSGFLISFGNGGFAPGRTVVVDKRGNSITLDSVGDEAALADWKERHPELGLVSYTADAVDPPLDHQTILGKKSRFQRTRLLNQGRTIYLDRETSRYWCVDNLHDGAAAHIEVFDASGRHVCEARLNGTLVPGSRDATKNITL
jgi:hypothetical protein